MLLCWDTLSRVREINQETIVAIWKREDGGLDHGGYSRGGETSGQILGGFFVFFFSQSEAIEFTDRLVVGNGKEKSRTTHVFGPELLEGGVATD